MYLVYIIHQIHNLFNEHKKLILLIIMTNWSWRIRMVFKHYHCVVISSNHFIGRETNWFNINSFVLYFFQKKKLICSLLGFSFFDLKKVLQNVLEKG